MKFFDRCKKLRYVLNIANVLLGIYLAFRIYGYVFMEKIDWFWSGNFSFSLVLDVILFFFWILLMIISLALKCVIKDAEEDLKAIMGVIEDTKA